MAKPVWFKGVDRPLECFYDGFPDTLYELDKFKGVKWCLKKTVRYAGYCDRVNFLDEYGLLNRDTTEFKGMKLSPFEVFSKIIYPKVRLEENEKDITVLIVTIEGVKDGHETSHTFETVDFYDEEKGITSMAKTTLYAAAILARMMGRGDISEKGLVPPAKNIRGRSIQTPTRSVF